MKIDKLLIASTPLWLALLAAGCGGNSKIKEVEAQRSQWVESLSDSIRAITSQRYADSLRLCELRISTADRLQEFSTVENAREVEPYHILTSEKGKYPLTKTGIAARITNSECFELVAALSSQRFESIRLATPSGETAESLRVAPDQALNYTANGLTVVAFSGTQADSIGMLAAANPQGPLTLDYLNGDGKTMKSITLDEQQRNWIIQTWLLAADRKETRHLENAMISASKKIEILKITQEKELSKTQNPK